MATIQSTVFAVLQAFAEVLPIGAIGHFAWLGLWLDLTPPAQPALSLGVHLGLMLAAAAFFWQDVGEMLQGLVRTMKGKRDPGARLAVQLIVATLPGVAIGLAINRSLGTAWHSALLTAWAICVGGVLLLLFDRACMTVKRIEHAGYGDVVLLGLAQAACLVPGVGRIAAVIAFARALGYERRDAARIALLMSIPALAASSAWTGYAMVLAPAPFPTNTVLLGLGVAFIVGLVLISTLMTWLRRRSFTPFAVYRVLFGGVVLAAAYGWI